MDGVKAKYTPRRAWPPDLVDNDYQMWMWLYKELSIEDPEVDTHEKMVVMYDKTVQIVKEHGWH